MIFSEKWVDFEAILPMRSKMTSKWINIMVVGAPNTGKTTIIDFLMKYYPTYHFAGGFPFSNQSSILNGLEDLAPEKIMPTFGVQVRFFPLKLNEDREYVIRLWELGRAISSRPHEVPRQYLRWMHGFLFTCRIDNANTIWMLNDWHDRIQQENKHLEHVTFFHMADLTATSDDTGQWDDLKEELQEASYLTSIYTQEGRIQALAGLKTLLNHLLNQQHASQENDS